MKLQHRLPSVSEFRTLRGYTDWGVPDEDATRTILNRSLSGVIAMEADHLIGMARTVGDGCLILYIQDVIIAPDYRSQGYGRRLIGSLLEEAAKTFSPDCTIGLFAAAGQSGFYKKLGFSTRRNPNYGPGMHGKLSELAKARNAA